MKRVRTWPRRILLILIWVAAAGYYLFDVSYLSWLLLVGAFGVPAFSLILSFFLLRTGKIRPQCGKEVCRKSEELLPVLKIRPPVLPGIIRGKIRSVNLFSGEKRREKFRLLPGTEQMPALKPYEGKLSGVLEFRAANLKARDLLGIFWLPVPAGKPVRTLYLPDSIPFPGELTRAGILDDISRLSSPSANGEREWKDIREYQSGDLLRDIHWKLSARREQIVVREYQMSGGNAVPVRMNWNGPAENLERKLARLLGLLEGLVREGIPFFCCLSLVNGEERTANSLEGVEEILWELLAKPCPKEKNGDFDREFPGQWLEVEPDSITLYREGVPEEVLV